MKKLFISAAILLSLWLALTSQRDGTIDRGLTEQPRTTAHQVAPKVDSAAAADLAKTGVDSNPSTGALELSLEKLTAAELRVALDELATETNPTAAETRQLVVRRWAESDPRAAAAWATQLPESSTRNDMLEQIAIAWTESQPAEAFAWLQALPATESQRVATIAAAYEVARVNPVNALELASQLPPDLDRDTLLEHAVSQWAGDTPSDAAVWGRQIAEPELREKLLATVAIAAAADDASAAAAFAASALRPGESQSRAAVAITQRWAQISPLDAADWVSHFPDLPVRDAAVENLVTLWRADDSESAENWLNALPSGAFRDTATRAFANQLSQ